MTPAVKSLPYARTLALIATLGPAAQRGLAQDADARPATVEAQHTAPSRAELTALVARFDASFNARDDRAIAAMFLPVHREHTALTLERLTTALRGKIRLERHSTITDTWSMGRHAVALVRATMSCPEGGEAQEATLVVVRREGDEERIVLAADVDAALLGMLPVHRDPAHPRASLHCPACNYRIDGGDNWLTVPSRPQRSGAFESLSFWSLESDVEVMVSVHLARAAEPALTWLERLGAELGAETSNTPVPWLPPRYAAPNARPANLDGAMLRIATSDRRVEAALATYGRTAWLFVVRGATVGIEHERAALDALLFSFALDDPALPPDQLATRIEKEHVGSRCQGAAFEHAGSGVRFEAPEGFSATLAGGFTVFDSAWTCPDGRVALRLRGLAPPEGLSHWSTATADRMVERTLQSAQLKISADSGWIRGGCTFAHDRRLDLADHEGRLVRLLRIALDDDLCVLLDARTTGALDPARARQVIDTLRRVR